jgi:hypothetical protein
MKANFKRKRSKNIDQAEQNIDQAEQNIDHDNKSDMSAEEFEEFVTKSGAAGSFMIFRSSKKDDELGIDEL